ncbi:MAG: hypothetical protein O7D36_10855 [Gammaproteobacteria bacterium]|nr:hypothetical protein [Gammaproteobacteria bacterium]
MLIYLKAQLLVMLALLLASPVVAEQVPDSSNQGKYINITFEIYGLDESASLLKNAALDLAKKISHLDPDPEEMTPEQLQALSSVILEANRLIQSVDESINQAGSAIETLRGPAKSLVYDAFIAVQQSTIEPTIQSVDASVTRWLIITFSSIFLIVVAAGYFIYLATTQIRSMARTLKSITEDYEIVPKRASQEKSQ